MKIFLLSLCLFSLNAYTAERVMSFNKISSVYDILETHTNNKKKPRLKATKSHIPISTDQAIIKKIVKSIKSLNDPWEKAKQRGAAVSYFKYFNSSKALLLYSPLALRYNISIEKKLPHGVSKITYKFGGKTYTAYAPSKLLNGSSNNRQPRLSLDPPSLYLDFFNANGKRSLTQSDKKHQLIRKTSQVVPVAPNAKLLKKIAKHFHETIDPATKEHTNLSLLRYAKACQQKNIILEKVGLNVKILKKLPNGIVKVSYTDSENQAQSGYTLAFLVEENWY